MLKNLLSKAIASSACGLAGAALFAPSTAYAQNLLTNGSFENGTYVDTNGGGDSLAIGSTSITGWTTFNAELAWLKTGNPYGVAPSNGTFFLDLTGYHDSSPYGGVTQNLATTIGQNYILSFDLGSNQTVGNAQSPVAVLASAGSTSQTFTFSAATGSTGNQYGSFSMPFTATTTTTAISLKGTLSTGGTYIGLDNASVVSSAAAPEPSALGLLASVAPVMGLVGAGIRRRKA